MVCCMYGSVAVLVDASDITHVGMWSLQLVGVGVVTSIISRWVNVPRDRPSVRALDLGTRRDPSQHQPSREDISMRIIDSLR
jgi:hypothetical protein